MMKVVVWFYDWFLEHVIPKKLRDFMDSNAPTQPRRVIRHEEPPPPPRIPEYLEEKIDVPTKNPEP